MLSGRRLDLLDPSPLDIEIADIALGLARVQRWNGQTIGEHGFSVAQHVLLVLDILRIQQPNAPIDLQRAALLHDASEYVTSDLITPFKAALGDAYKALEARVQAAVHIRFALKASLPEPWARAIKRADKAAAFLEATQLAGFAAEDARRLIPYRGRVPEMALIPWPAARARQEFLARFAGLFP
ncbi:MAG: HD family hydrolase [Alphaproteobacteria bacterium]|nr:HD family hydrolase [Alphaproteobacteria bacterium]